METLAEIVKTDASEIGNRIWHASSLPSTNTCLTGLVAGGAANHGSVVWADEQTAGRGRLGRTWASPSGGGLYVSVFIREVQPRLIHCVAALAVRHAIAEVSEASVDLKWPNDVLLEGRKVSGILIEQIPGGSIVGIGANTNLDRAAVDRIAPEGTSIRVATGQWVDHRRLLDLMLAQLQQRYVQSASAPETLFGEWKASLVTLGQTVEVQTGRDSWIGHAVDVANDGALLLLKDKRLVRVYAADVRIRPT